MKKSFTVKHKQQVKVIPADSPEYRIAVSQLQKLETIAVERLFSPDEARLYDILCKSLSLVKDASVSSTSTYRKELELVADKDLIDIARETQGLVDLGKVNLKVIKDDDGNGTEKDD